jgi:DNA polymerase III subunit alpha
MFIPLHVKSDYSLGYGTIPVEEIAGRGAELGYPAVALTDLENLYGQVRFHHRCRICGVRPLTGIELRPGFDGRREIGLRSGRVVLLAADETGYRSLCRIVSRRRAGGKDAGGTIASDPVRAISLHPEGLFAMSDDPDVIARLLSLGAFPRERLGLLFVRPSAAADDHARREAAGRLGVRPVADLDVVFAERGDHSLHALQLAIRQGKRLAEVATGSDVESRSRRLRSPAEAAALFADLPEALDAAAEIAEACSLDLTALDPGLPGLDLPRGETAAHRLRRLCNEALADAPRDPSEEHGRRLDTELSLFERLGFSGLLLVVAEILAHCRTAGIPVAMRGSAVSSLTLHLLGGSPVDPLAHGLLFERFLHPEKSSWPDIDIDLPWHLRDGVIDWVSRRFGRDRVATVAAIHTFGRRSALREGLKAWGAAPSLIERLSRALPPEDLDVADFDFLGLAEAAAGDGTGRVIPGGEGEPAGAAAILPLIRRLVDKPRHVAAHPGGILVGRYPLEDILPLELAQKGVVITQYDAASVERLGMVKIDLLGNRALSELEEALSLAGGPLRLDSIPREDPETLALVDRGETVGCFQLESPAMRSLLTRLPVRRQSDLVAALALIRPGAAAGEVKAAFVRRARGTEPAVPTFAIMADRLRETNGLLLYEEDIMVLLNRTGGLTLAEADVMRSAIVGTGGDAAHLAALETAFLAKARERRPRAPLPLLRRAWSTAARFAAYSFNKAHAASYARLAYLSAWTKTHLPPEFACALLNHHQGLYPLRVEAGELVRIGVELRKPHVNFSGYHSAIEERGDRRGAVRVGLDKVKGLSLRTAEKLLDERGRRGRFGSLRDFLERVRPRMGEIASLVLSGACDGLLPLTAADYPFAHFAALERLREGCDPAALDTLPIPFARGTPEDQVRLYRGLVRVRNELRYLEMHLSGHPMALLRGEARRYRCIQVKEALAAPRGEMLRVAVTIAAMRRVPTRQGVMQFLTVEDETGLLEGALFPPVYRRLGERVTTPGPFLVEGKLRRQEGATHLEVTWIAPFRERQRPFGNVKE